MRPNLATTFGGGSQPSFASCFDEHAHIHPVLAINPRFLSRACPRRPLARAREHPLEIELCEALKKHRQAKRAWRDRSTSLPTHSQTLAVPGRQICWSQGKTLMSRNSFSSHASRAPAVVSDSSPLTPMAAVKVSLPVLAESPRKAVDNFDIFTSYRRILEDDQVSVPLAAILALSELVEYSQGRFLSSPLVYTADLPSAAGTMFELVQALNQGAELLRSHFSNPISLNAGCELFIAFVTLFPHESDVRPSSLLFSSSV